MKLKNWLSPVILLCLFLLPSCTPESNDEIMLSDSLQTPPVFFGFYKNGTLLYYQEENGTASFYTFDETTRQSSPLGTIERYYLDTGFTTLLENNLYFYAGILNSNNEVSNSLFSINIDDRTLELHEHTDTSLPGVNVFSSNDYVITLKNERDSDIITTYLEFYHPSTNSWENKLVNTFNEVSRRGSALYVMYADPDYIYVITDIYDSDGNCNSVFIKYDCNLNEIENIPLSGAVADFINSSNGRIVEMKVFGSFLYLRDLSGNGFLGEIENEDINLIKSSSQFISASSLYHDTTPIFFTRESNTVFVLDVSTGKLTEYSLNVKDGHSIAQMWVANDKLLIIAWDESRLQILHFLEQSELSEIEI